MDRERAAGVSDSGQDTGASAEGNHAPAVALSGESAALAAAFAAGEAESAAESLEGELDELVATAAQRDEYLALAQRTQADFENYRKRVARDAGAAEARGLSKLARELLPALDNLDRALHAAAGAEEALLDGLRLVQRELLGALGRVGIEPYGAAGEQFDPGLHEAVAQQPFEGVSAGEVVEVYQSGYRLAGVVIRPARVLVAG